MLSIHLGPVRMLEPLGVGGMSEVWGGQHLGTGTLVAVKIMTAKGTRDALFQDTFRNEVRAASRLDHPGIIGLYDYGVISPAQSEATGTRLSAGSPYLVMERAARPLQLSDVGSWEGVRHLTLSLLDALAHAHAREVIHRDLKPGNILLSAEGGPPVWKLSDFGVAHALDRAPRTGSVEDVYGTPAYMAPEQFWGRWRDYGPWTDLYALGILVWRLVTGNLPFRAESLVDMASAHLKMPTPEFRPRFAVPEGLEAWLARALQKNPFLRFRRAADARWALMTAGDAPEEDGDNQFLEEEDLTSETTTRIERPVEMDLPRSETPAVLSPLAAPSMPRHAEVRRARRLRSLSGLGAHLLKVRTLPLVGRPEERERLWVALRRVREDGDLRISLITGQAGMGKTALANWFVRRAEETGAATVLRASHGPMSGVDGLPKMIARAFQCMGLSRDETRDRLREQLRARGGSDPYEWAALAELIHPSPPEITGGVRFHAPEERYALIRRTLERLGADAGFVRPVLLWLEDVQWGADALGFVEYALQAERMGTFPILVLMTAQEEVLEMRPLEQRLLDELLAWPRTDRLRLGALPGQAMGELVRDHLGLRGALAQKVEHRAAGNPQYAVEMVAEWVERGALRPTAEGFALAPGVLPSLPDSLHSLWKDQIVRVLSRSASVVERMQAPLELLAALGTEVEEGEWRTLCALAGARPPEGFLASVHALVELREGSLGWTHPLVRESLVRMAREGGRWARWNALAAALFAKKPARLGRHLMEAGEPARALEPLLTGAQAALKVCDYRVVFGLLAERDAALDALGASEVDARRIEGLLTSARAFQESGRIEDARTSLDAAESAAQASGDRAAMGQIHLACGALDAATGALASATARYERALTVFAVRGARAGVAAARVGLAEVKRAAGETSEAVRLFEEAVAELESLGEPMELADALTKLGAALRQRNALADARACYLQARPIYASLGHQRGVATCHQGLGAVAELQHQYEDAETKYRLALELFDGMGHQSGRASALNGLAEVARAQGRLLDAENGYRAALRAYEAAGEGMSFVSACNLGLVLVARERYADARPIFQEALREVESQGRRGWAGAMHAMLLVTAVEDEGAWAQHLSAARLLLGESGFADPDVVSTLEAAARRAHALGREAQGEEAWLLALATAKELDNPALSERLLTEYPQWVGALSLDVPD